VEAKAWTTWHTAGPMMYALGMVVLLALFSIGGDNGLVYVVSLLGVPNAPPERWPACG
jgi:hypothetical protein